MERIAKERVRSGDGVAVITLADEKNGASWPVRSVEDGVVVYRFSAPNIFSYQNLAKHNFVLKLVWHLIDIFNFRSARIIKKILEHEKPDEIQTHNLMGVGFSLRTMIKRSKNQKIGNFKWIHYLHDVQLVEPSGVLPWNHAKDSLAQKIYSLVVKLMMGKPDEVWSPSRFMIGFYKKRGFFVGSQYHLSPITYHGTLNIEHGTMNYGRQAHNQKAFLFVGSLVEHKGIRLLMRAWDMVDKKSPVELHIVGDGKLRREVEDWARGDKRVRVYGRLGGKELEEVYKKCYVLVFPSICIENHPTVIDEAHQFGLRVIASNTGGVGEMVKDGDVLVEPGNAQIIFTTLHQFSTYSARLF